MRETASMALSRRQTLQRGSLAAVVPVLVPTPALASTKTDAEKVLEALQPLSGFVDDGKWDAVRTVLAQSPVVELWKTGNSKNWIRAAALSAGDPELIELSEDLSSALQLTDQYVYDNNFIYFQPGNGKARRSVDGVEPDAIDDTAAHLSVPRLEVDEIVVVDVLVRQLERRRQVLGELN